MQKNPAPSCRWASAGVTYPQLETSEPASRRICGLNRVGDSGTSAEDEWTEPLRQNKCRLSLAKGRSFASKTEFQQRFGADRGREEGFLSNVVVSSHPLVQHKLAELRDVRTQPADFRRAVRTLAVLLAQEAMLDLPLVEKEVTTPLAVAKCRVLRDAVGIFPILRAGLGMAEGIIELLPEAEVWHVGLYRDEATLQPREYYNKLPACRRVTVALLVDPMLATGGSAAHACEIIKAAGVPRLKLLSLIAAPEGIALVKPRDARGADPRRCCRRSLERARVHLSRARRRRRPSIRDRQCRGRRLERPDVRGRRTRAKRADESRRYHSQEA